MKLQGVKALKKVFKNLEPEASHTVIVVGFTAEYAVYVHENMTANHPNGGEAKFLETSVKRHSPEVARRITIGVKNSIKLKKKTSLGSIMALAAGLIQREAQKLVPVDTGNLKGSARTYKEK